MPVIDGLFGLGLDRRPADDWRRLIETVNWSGIPVLAVDALQASRANRVIADLVDDPGNVR
ncbi:MAG: hypothetical protein ACLP2Y_11310 [Limisphaerales bacterium]